MWNYLGKAVSEDIPDGIKLKAYECENFDAKTGLCKEYDNRPEICRDTTCKHDNIKAEPQDEMNDKEKFIIIKGKTLNL